MGLSDVLSLVALALSTAALVVGSLIAHRQVKSVRDTNHIMVLISQMNEFRTRKFNEDHDYVCDRLAAEHNSHKGVSELPQEAKDAFYNITYFYQILGVLVLLGTLDRDDVVTLYQRRLKMLWAAAEPFIKAERRRRPENEGLLKNLESLAEAASKLPDGSLNRLIERKIRNGY